MFTKLTIASNILREYFSVQRRANLNVRQQLSATLLSLSYFLKHVDSNGHIFIEKKFNCDIEIN